MFSHNCVVRRDYFTEINIFLLLGFDLILLLQLQISKPTRSKSALVDPSKVSSGSWYAIFAECCDLMWKLIIGCDNLQPHSLRENSYIGIRGRNLGPSWTFRYHAAAMFEEFQGVR